MISLDRGLSQESYTRFSQAARAAPDNAVFVNALGEAHEANGRSEDAAACFRRAIALRPGYERAHNNLGLFWHARGDFAAAGACFSEAIRLNPRYATAHNNLGAALQAQGRFDEAVAHFQEAIQVRPDYAEAHFNTGGALEGAGRSDRGRCQLPGGNPDQAVIRSGSFTPWSCARAVRAGLRGPGLLRGRGAPPARHAETQRRLGDLLVRKKDWPAALSALERAVAPNLTTPTCSPVSFGPGNRSAIGGPMTLAWSGSGPTPKNGWPRGRRRGSSRSRHSPCRGRCHASWPSPAAIVTPGLSRTASWACRSRSLHSSVRTRTGRLRVGYLSADYRDHPISHLLHGFFGRHDRERFEIFAYSFGLDDDSPYRLRITAECEHFVDVASLSYPDIARRIAADGIHILVDLTGHTGVNRLGSLAMRPAPIRSASWGCSARWGRISSTI